MNAKDVLKAIREYKDPAAVIREVSVADPFERLIYNRWYYENYTRYVDKRLLVEPEKWVMADSIPDDWVRGQQVWERRIDALVIDTHRTAVEIKVTRADFRSETEAKRAPWRYYTHKFVYAVPEGLVSKEEVPDYAGLWYVTERGIQVVKKCRVNKEAADLPEYLVKSLMGRLSRYEWDREKVDKGVGHW